MLKKWQTFKWQREEWPVRYELKSLDPLKPGWMIFISIDFDANTYTTHLRYRDLFTYHSKPMASLESAKSKARKMAEFNGALRTEM